MDRDFLTIEWKKTSCLSDVIYIAVNISFKSKSDIKTFSSKIWASGFPAHPPDYTCWGDFFQGAGTWRHAVHSVGTAGLGLSWPVHLTLLCGQTSPENTQRPMPWLTPDSCKSVSAGCLLLLSNTFLIILWFPSIFPIGQFLGIVKPILPFPVYSHSFKLLLSPSNSCHGGSLKTREVT